MNDVSYSYKGAISRIFETEVRKTFTYRHFWLQNDIFYRNKQGVLVNVLNVVQFKLILGNCSMLDDHKVGNIVIVQFMPKGRIWENKVLQDLEVIDMKLVGFKDLSEVNQPQESKSEGAASDKADDFQLPTQLEFESDLPF